MTTQTRLRGGAKDLGTDKVRVPSWADGEYSAEVMGIISVGLSIKDDGFTVSLESNPFIDSSTINDIKSQTNDEEKKIYTLEAVVNVGGTTLSEETSDPTDGKTYSSFVMQLTDSGIDVTITSEDIMLSPVAGKTIIFTRNTGSTE